jgi:hypothetical protein
MFISGNASSLYAQQSFTADSDLELGEILYCEPHSIVSKAYSVTSQLVVITPGGAVRPADGGVPIKGISPQMVCVPDTPAL